MKLLNLTIRTYVIYSVMLALISVPIFYFVISGIFMSKVDEELRRQKINVEKIKQEFRNSGDVELYRRFDPGFELILSNSFQSPDTLYTSLRYDISENKKVLHREYHTTVILNNQFYELIIRKPLVGTKDLIWAVVITQGIFILGLIMGLAVINRKFSQRIWKPFYETLAGLKKFKLEENNALILNPSRIAEFNDLQLRLNELITRNKNVYDQQKKFTDNAAHELQTPLAVFQSNLELLMQSKSFDEEQALITQTLLDAVRRLSKLQRALLLLARIEGKQFIEISEVSLEELSNGIFSRFEHKIEDKSLVIKKVFETVKIRKANPELVEILLTNLLTNAIRYTPVHGQIRWILREDFLEIQNTGERMTLREEELFDRFKKDELTGNIGLGLNIVKQICENYGWLVEYQYKDGFHIFTVRFND